MNNRPCQSIVGSLLLAGALLASQAVQAQAVNGVSANEVVIGTIQDLSGPVVAFSKEVINGLRMRFDEANAAGGVAGRKVRLIVEDSGYDTKKGVMAAQKLILEHEMGEFFKVIGLVKGADFACMGFANGDRSHRL